MLDEPVASLDPLAPREVMRILVAAVADGGLTVLLSSHVVAELERVCDHLGRVRLAGDIDDIQGRLHATSFVIAAPSLTAAAVFAFALGVLCGALLRNTIAAMAATLAGFLVVRLSVEEYVRPHYRPPLVRTTEPGTLPGVRDTDWTVAEGWADRAGRLVPDRERTAALRQLDAAGTPVDRYLLDNDLLHRTEFHPDSSFWLFQSIESAVFLTLAAALLTAAVYLIHRRA